MAKDDRDGESNRQPWQSELEKLRERIAAQQKQIDDLGKKLKAVARSKDGRRISC